MRTIWKYPMELRTVQVIPMPYHAIVLCAQAQDDRPVLWVELDTENAMRERTFHIYGTGHTIDEQRAYGYIDTLQIGNHVWHVYEARP